MKAVFTFVALQAAVLGLVQGLSEFLPISSSGHLVLVRWVLGWEDFLGSPAAEKAFDVMLHAGTFTAVVWYFWEDLKRFVRAFLTREGSPETRKLVGMLLVSTVPGGILGVLFEKSFEEKFSSPLPIAVCLIGLGILLALAERFSNPRRGLEAMGWLDAILLGMAQALALFPGVSRSGVTMTTALFLGIGRESAARYSFLMSLPLIGGAVLWEGRKLLRLGISSPVLLSVGWGFLASAVAGYLTIRYFLRYLSRGSFYPFAAYRVVLGILVLAALAAHPAQRGLSVIFSQ